MSIAMNSHFSYNTDFLYQKLFWIYESFRNAFMIPIEQRKEALSKAYARAIAAKAGVNVSEPEQDFGIDLSLRQVAVRNLGGINRHFDNGASLDIQLKCTETAEVTATEVIYDLEAKNYNDLADPEAAYRILVLLVVPTAETDWIDLSPAQLSIRNCAYWYSLKGQLITSNAATKRIRIPITQRFTPEAVNGFFEKIKIGDDL